MLHKDLASGKWFKMTFFEQMANVGSEVERTINWKNKGVESISQKAFERCLELLYLTIEDKKNRSRLKELTRVYEVLVDYFSGENIYHSSDILWKKYFYAFNWAARIGK
ncbi:MAG: hypothetical protein UT63_C0030G0003 [Candidatus Gottesmanbacteria bacterium GW2011_GWC2_39_8]|uniref:Uncharacterized protein n=1 Tax=Candidatus Gottesmanbacteria bacterium GW2011_GWC2_39_8 TaxID=1618450 RepID=A0A0G0SDR6_9BACT|nr:MAG: hypothetical protein UT63_C0030G0003 [Candidatus Gottesmanbacteria bacterium GW2011_GWC2_39_8]